MQKILNTLASFEALGVQEGDRNQIALFSGASPTSSSYANNLSALSSAGLIHYPTRGRVQLTDARSASRSRPLRAAAISSPGRHAVDETNLCANCRALHPEMLLEDRRPPGR